MFNRTLFVLGAGWKNDRVVDAGGYVLPRQGAESGVAGTVATGFVGQQVRVVYAAVRSYFVERQVARFQQADQIGARNAEQAGGALGG